MQASEPDSLATHPQAAAIKAGKPDVQAPSGAGYTGNSLLLSQETRGRMSKTCPLASPLWSWGGSQPDPRGGLN